MVLEGVVTNVAAFGAFVDVGVHQDGLVHVSAMSRGFVSDPRQVAKPGDIVRVKVLSVDPGRKRISLTMRLDDEPGAPARPDGPGKTAGRPDRRRDNRGSTTPGAASSRQGAAPGGAMAQALRRAGLADRE
jgi:protein Tex